MGDLSRNFSKHEFRCRCGCDRAEVNPRLVEALQELRDLARRPIRITSRYRCPDHNRAQHGKKRSQYLLGNAADLVIDGLSVIEMYCLADKVAAVRNGGIGLYPKNGIIHVDVRDKGYILIWLTHGWVSPRSTIQISPVHGNNNRYLS